MLFRAAYRPGGLLVRLWSLPSALLVTSAYAAEEAHRNLPPGRARERLAELLLEVDVRDPLLEPLPDWVMLAEKDRPILQAAIATNASHLLTQDTTHFGRYFWQVVEGVMVLPGAAYLKQRHAL